MFSKIRTKRWFLLVVAFAVFPQAEYTGGTRSFKDYETLVHFHTGNISFSHVSLCNLMAARGGCDNERKKRQSVSEDVDDLFCRLRKTLVVRVINELQIIADPVKRKTWVEHIK